MGTNLFDKINLSPLACGQRGAGRDGTQATQEPAAASLQLFGVIAQNPLFRIKSSKNYGPVQLPDRVVRTADSSRVSPQR